MEASFKLYNEQPKKYNWQKHTSNMVNNNIFNTFILAFVFLFSCFTLNANADVYDAGNSETGDSVTHEAIVASGIPESAIPAKAFFYRGDSIEQEEAWTGRWLEQSCLTSEDQDFGTYYFFVKQTLWRELEFPTIDIWVYDAVKKKSKLVYSQPDDEEDMLNIADMDYGFYITSKDSSFLNPGSKESITLSVKTAHPTILLSCFGEASTPHAVSSTMIINVENGAIRTLEGQKFVALMPTEDRALMAAEMGLSRSYIITTDTKYDFKSQKIRELTDSESERLNDGEWHIEMLDHVFLRPFVNVYTLDGKQVGKLALPMDYVDIAR